MNVPSWHTVKNARQSVAVILAATVLFGGVWIYSWYLSDRIVPHTMIGAVPVGGLTRPQAADVVQAAVDSLQNQGIRLTVGDRTEAVALSDIGFDIDVGATVDDAFAQGHTGMSIKRLATGLSSLWQTRTIRASVNVDQPSLQSQLDQISGLLSEPRQDIRLVISGTKVRLATDTSPGHTIDHDDVAARIMSSLTALDDRPIAVTLRDDQPIANPDTADKGVVQARALMSRGLSLTYEDMSFFLSREKIGGWITSEYQGDQLVAALDRSAVAQYVTRIAKLLAIEPEPPRITTEGDRVTGFSPARVGRAVKEDELIGLIVDSLTGRTGKDKAGDMIVIPTKITKLALDGLDSATGITELIGKAVTTLTGSPKNRISNIKNGVHFLTGAVVPPGEEFSTLGRLGTVDNTTGYLPELVIKGDRTTPEFGGGLCQVSTTLFRAVMNAGLPVTMRQNHSYRVSYYEKDGNGVKIGPGLDATIFEPNPDFRFRNDTATPVLIVGYVIGDKVTFELYGTKDGRTSAIDGPHLLSEVPAGDPVDIPAPTLPLGMRKQVETPHPGGTAIATYTITYPDGHTDVQVFRSKYRPWPAKFLVGTNEGCTTPAECSSRFPELFATPFPKPSPSTTP